VVTLPGGEIASALNSGAIDASEWIGPWQDMAIG
jgi:TRAP-type mannitol/chloroaromatic compound transport system substrate-binding protein